MVTLLTLIIAFIVLVDRGGEVQPRRIGKKVGRTKGSPKGKIPLDTSFS
jgi:hypothetical protein